MEVKVYLQKVKHLEYEQEKRNKEIEIDGQQAEYRENQYFRGKLKSMGKEKKDLKNKYSTVEGQNIGKVISQDNTNDMLYQNAQK